MNVEQLRTWSHVLLWLSIILPVLGGLAAVARFYVERAEKRIAAAEVVELQNRVARAEALQQPRRLTTDQMAILVGRLKQARGALYDITSVVNDSDGYQFALQFIEVLKEAGWRGRIVPNISHVSGPVHGVGIVVRDSNQLPPVAALLLEAFRAANLQDIGLYIANNAREDLVEIRIGLKRPRSDTQRP